jgi:hypothetical protein
VAERHLSETIGPIGVVFRADAEELRGQIAEQRATPCPPSEPIRTSSSYGRAPIELRPRVAAARAAIEKLRTEKP